jgi:hypothetical protein
MARGSLRKYRLPIATTGHLRVIAPVTFGFFADHMLAGALAYGQGGIAKL